MLRFGQKGKLAWRFVEPFEIRKRVEDMAYRLALPPEPVGVHNILHASMQKRYAVDASHVLKYKPIEIQEDATYVEWPLKIIDTKERGVEDKDDPLDQGSAGAL